MPHAVPGGGGPRKRATVLEVRVEDKLESTRVLEGGLVNGHEKVVGMSERRNVDDNGLRW